MDVSAIAAQASAADAGELFVYALDRPLTLPRGEAAMVPIISRDVARDVAGDALTIVSANRSGPQVAQNGFRLKNDSDLRLSSGPITVYLDGLSPRDSKLIAFGIDLDLVAQRDADENRAQLLQIIVEKGVLKQRVQRFLTQSYALKTRRLKPKPS